MTIAKNLSKKVRLLRVLCRLDEAQNSLTKAKSFAKGFPKIENDLDWEQTWIDCIRQNNFKNLVISSFGSKSKFQGIHHILESFFIAYATPSR